MMLVDEKEAVVRSEDGMELWCSRLEDETRIAALLEFHGVPSRLAEEEKFLVAQRNGEGILAALEYRVEASGLMLGRLVTDPRVKERPLARALYTEAYALAMSLGITEIRARPTLYGDYPYDVGYWRWGRNWHCCATEPLVLRGILPERGWRRMLALWRVFSAPSFEVSSKQAQELVEPEVSSAPEVKH